MADGAQVANPNDIAIHVWTHSTISRPDDGTRDQGTGGKSLKEEIPTSVG